MSDRFPVPLNSPRASQADDDQHLIDLWLHGKSEHAQEAYKRDVEQFVDFVDLPLAAVKLEDFWAWADHLIRLDLKPASQARKLAAVKSLFSFGHRVGYLQFNVGAAVTLPSIPDKLAERILPEPEIQRILNAAGSLRDRVMLRVFYATGARVSELANVYWGALVERASIDGRPTGQITLLGKGNKTRTLRLPPDTWAALQELREQAAKKGHAERNHPVFRSRKKGPLSRQQIWRIVRNTSTAAGLTQDVSPHWLRHAHASHALDHGAPAHLVKDSLGHKSLTTTSKYAHARPDDSSSLYLKAERKPAGSS